MNTVEREVELALEITEEVTESKKPKTLSAIYATSFTSLILASGVVLNLLGNPSTNGCVGGCPVVWRQ